MTISNWITASPTEISGALLSLIVVYALIILYTRVTGLRSFSKMSAPDFAMTVAVGSLFAGSISNPSPSIAIAAICLAGLFAGQWFFAWIRRRSQAASSLLDNRPILLMEGSRIFESNLDRAQVSREDLFAKLREANVLALRQVHAVVFETTGDVSVLHSANDDTELEQILLEGVRR